LAPPTLLVDVNWISSIELVAPAVASVGSDFIKDVLGCEAGAKPPEQDRHEPVVLVRSVDGAGGKCLVMRA
jgi:hypothetical protein